MVYYSDMDSVGGVDVAAVEACRDHIRVLQSRLVTQEERRKNLQRLSNRLLEFRDLQQDKARVFSYGFPEVRFATNFADSLSDTVAGSHSTTAELQVSTALRKACRNVDDTRGELEAARKRLNYLLAGN